MAGVDWHIKGSYIEACSCDFGCPCNLNGFPTKGFCHGSIGVHIEEGSYGDVSLDGLNFVGSVKWPGAIHEGNGVGAFFIDDKASDPQRDAMFQIFSGQVGGMPWELIAQTVSDMKGPFYAPITFEDNGTKSKASVKGVDVQLEPFTNPVTGEEHEVHTVLPGGFIWKDGLVCKATRNVSEADGVEYDWSGQNGYYAKVEWASSDEHAKTKFGR